MPHPLIAAALAAPKTHCVVTTYADGTVKRHETRSLASSETYAIGERRKIGHDLISRETGKTVCDCEGIAMTPSPAVLAKVAALLQAIDETPISAPLDVSAIRAQLADRDVAHWLDVMWREAHEQHVSK